MWNIVVTSSVAILVITGLRQLFRNKVSSRWIYGLWLPVALFLLLSLPFLLNEESEVTAVRQFFQIPVLGITLGQLATILWIAGMLAVALWFLAANISFQKSLRSSREALDCPESPVPVWVSGIVSTPCLFGLFRPGVYLTPDCATDPESRHHVLTHELTHLRHWDHIWSFVRCLCLCIFWFHPLVWVAAHLSKQDCELACDEGALKRLGEEQRIAYGQTIVELAATAPRKDPFLPGRAVAGGTVSDARKIKKSSIVFGIVGGALIAFGAFWVIGTNTLQSISVTTAPHQSRYMAGQMLNPDGLTLQLTFFDGTVRQITEGFTCHPTQLETGGTQNITVSYGGKTASFSVTVYDVKKTGTCGPELTWYLTTENDLFIEGTGSMYDYTGYSSPWEGYRGRIQNIFLPDGLTTIGAYAFDGCTQLKQLYIPDSVENIGEGAFFGCSSLLSIVIPQKVKTVRSWTFHSCSSLKKVTMREGVKTIEMYVFLNCAALDEVVIPRSATKIHSLAFHGCKNANIIRR